MALVDVHGLYFPPIAPVYSLGAASSTIDATGEMYAWIGRVRWADKSVSSRQIRRARFLFGAVTKAGGSGLTFSLQDVDLANGPTCRPDGVQDQTVAIANGNTSFVSNTVITTGDLSADRTVTLGQHLAAVLEFDGSGRLGSDSVAIVGGNTLFNQGPSLLTASWASANVANSIVFECADGAVAVLDPAIPLISTTVNIAFNSGSTPDEVALKFTPDFNCKVDALWAVAFAGGGGSDYDLVLYEGTTALQTASVDTSALRANSQNPFEAPITETTLTAGTTYYVAVKPTTTNSISFRYYDVSSSAVRDCLPGGAQCSYSTRTDAGSWSDTDTRYPAIGVRLSAIDNGAGGAGGLAANPIGGFIG